MLKYLSGKVFIMSLRNKIEQHIKELEGGKFQKLGDAYLSRK